MFYSKKLTIEGFLSFEEVQDYNFQQGRATLIQGRNLTDDQTESNGAGKSSFRDAIYYLYLGSSSSPQKKDIDLINNNCESAFLEWTLQDTFGAELIIRRTINRKGSSTLDIRIGGMSQKDKFPSVKEGNKYLLDLIGISATDFQYYYLISRDRYKSFFRASDSDKKDFIGRFSRAEKILPVYDIVQQEIDSLKQRKLECELQQTRIEGSIQTYEEQIEDLKGFDFILFEKQLQEDCDNELQLLNDKKEEVTQDISLYKNEGLPKLKEDLQKIEESLRINKDQQVKIEEVSFERDRLAIQNQDNSITEKKNKSLVTIREKQAEKLELNKELIQLVTEIQGIIICPNCKFEFILGDPDADINELKELKLECEGVIKEIDQCILDESDLQEKLKLRISEITEKSKSLRIKEQEKENKLLQLRNKATELNKQKNEKRVLIQNLESDITIEENKLIQIEQQIKDFDDQYVKNELSKKLADNTMNQSIFLAKIENQQQEVERIKSEVLNIAEQILEKAQWIINFKRFYTYLTNRSLMSIQGYANSFLKKMGTNLQLQLEGYKTLASGDIREKISSNLLRDGVLEGSTDKGSSGEQARLECAIIVANQSIINNTCESGGLDLLFIDEVLDSIDSVGIQSLIDSLNSLGKTIFLTTHIQPKYLPENVLIIEKMNGKSHIVC